MTRLEWGFLPRSFYCDVANPPTSDHFLNFIAVDSNEMICRHIQTWTGNFHRIRMAFYQLNYVAFNRTGEEIRTLMYQLLFLHLIRVRRYASNLSKPNMPQLPTRLILRSKSASRQVRWNNQPDMILECNLPNWTNQVHIVMPKTSKVRKETNKGLT